MVKKVLLVVVLVALALGFGVVSAQDDLSGIDPTGQTITYWHEWGGAQLEAINVLIADFNATNEYGITVETLELGDSAAMRDAMSAGITSGDLPNLVGGFATDAQGYYLDGVALAIDPYLDDPTWGFTEEERANLNFDVLDVNRIPGDTFNDQMLAWSIGYSGVIMSVNLGMLSELGFEAAPATLDEFRAVACAAAESTGPAGEDVQGFPLRTNPQDMEAFILSQGGRIWDPETQQFDFTNEATINVLTFFQQLVADGCAYLPETNFANTADFAASLNPMAVGSTVGVPFIQRDAQAATDAGGTGVTEWENTTPPWAEGSRTLVLNFRSVIMISGTPEQNLATWLFLKYLASEAAQITWTEGTLYQPYNNVALENLSQEFLDANPQFEDVRQLLLDDSIAKFGDPQLLGIFQATGELGNLIAALATDPSLDIATAAAEAQDRANEVLAEAQDALN